MEIEIEPGKYVVAVSGGVDSVVLLYLLYEHTQKNLANIQFVVAHFDHGIREDSAQDRIFVEHLAKQYELEFFYEEGNLGEGASEALAREKRYAFLRRVKKQISARAIIAAHHQDDVLETAILNLLRGTGRRGLSALRSTDDIKRPLLDYPKKEIVAYANSNNLHWREDSTNTDVRYARNYIRRNIVPRFSEENRAQFLRLIAQTAERNILIDGLLDACLHVHSTQTILDRSWFMMLDHALSREVLLSWLRLNGIFHLDRRRIEQTVVLVKTLAHGKLIDVNAVFQLKITTDGLALIRRER